MPGFVRILDAGDSCPTLPLVEQGEGVIRAVVWPGVDAYTRSLHHMVLHAGAATVAFNHPSEAVYYVVNGTARVSDLDVGDDHDLVVGSMIHVEPRTTYRFAAGDGGAEIVGGPCPHDPALYESLSVA